MSYSEGYKPTITERLFDLLTIADSALDDSLDDVFLFLESKKEFVEKYRAEIGGYSFVFVFREEPNSKYFIWLLEKIEEVLHRINYIVLFIELNESDIEWTDELDRIWNTLDHLKRKDLLSAKYGLQRHLMALTIPLSVTEYSNNKNLIEEKADVSDETLEQKIEQPEQENLTANSSNKNFIEEQGDLSNETFEEKIAVKTRKGRPPKKDEGGLTSSQVAKIFLVLSEVDALPFQGKPHRFAQAFEGIEKFSNIRKDMSRSKPLTESQKEEITTKLEAAIDLIKHWTGKK